MWRTSEMPLNMPREEKHLMWHRVAKAWSERNLYKKQVSAVQGADN